MPTIRSIPVHHPLSKLAAVCVIAVAGILVGMSIRHYAALETSSRSFDWTVYDKLFRMRSSEDRTRGPIALVVVDDWSLSLMDKYLTQRWPWSRESYAKLIEIADQAGAREIVFDYTFDGPSPYDKDFDDSQLLATAASKSKIPVIFGVHTTDNPHAPSAFAIPIPKPLLGSATVPRGATVLRWYHLYLNNIPTLAMASAMQIDPRLRKFKSDDPFLLHYYGPFGSVGSTDPDNRPTHARYSFADVVLPHCDCKGSDIHPVDLAELKDKIIIVGAIAQGLFEEKSSPYSALYPGIDYHATAIENLLSGYRVLLARRAIENAALIIPSFLAAFAAIFLPRTWMKLTALLLIAAAILLTTYLLFRSFTIIFLTPIPPLAALFVSMLLGILWAYFTEGRQRHFLSRAFSHYVAPAVVQELERNNALTLGGQRKTITILFSDIRSFTTISEKMSPEGVEKFMNTYLGSMTDVVLGEKGTVDKYIGDAVMAFWNAPLDQPDHPICAAKAALRMLASERRSQAMLQELTGEEIYTRIGIATGEVTVGNFGSAEKINYTALGDSVNLASRLEGANKIYGSQILMAEPAALAAKERVLIRRLGLLRVKGKSQAMAVYEALAELPGTREQIDRKERYEQAFDLYLARKWSEAEQTLVQMIETYPNDHSAAKLLEVVREFRAAPPGADWDGVYTAHEK